LDFLRARYAVDLPLGRRVDLVGGSLRATHGLRGYHTLAEVLTVGDAILRRADKTDLTVVECGVGKGSSTCKLSLFVRSAHGRLHAFDSFRGMPPNDEEHEHLDGRRTRFRAGAFRGRQAEVQRNLERFGAPEVVQLHKGWFETTLPAFAPVVDVVLLDVDLMESTRTCLRQLFPRLRADGVVFSQDGHLRGIIDLLARESFWRDEVGVEPPRIEGLGTHKLLAIRRRPRE
jgi:O-methyltransferase